MTEENKKGEGKEEETGSEEAAGGAGAEEEKGGEELTEDQKINQSLKFIETVKPPFLYRKRTIDIHPYESFPG